jgi:hypothetical protein
VIEIAVDRDAPRFRERKRLLDLTALEIPYL